MASFIANFITCMLALAESVDSAQRLYTHIKSFNVGVNDIVVTIVGAVMVGYPRQREKLAGLRLHAVRFVSTCRTSRTDDDATRVIVD